MLKMTGKHTHSCPYCDVARPTLQGIKRHISRTPACAKKNDEEFRKRWGMRHPRRIPPPPPPVPTLGAVGGDALSNVEMAGINYEHGRRSQSVAIEELPDEPYLRTKAKLPVQRAHRSPSVVIEEVETTATAHPFADPTRPSLYPEPYPDPTAGRAFQFEPIAPIPPPLYDTSLTNPDVFREAYWLGNLDIPDYKLNEYFTLPRTGDWHWNNVEQFHREIDNLPHGPAWYKQTVYVPGDEGEVEILDLWKRDVVEVVKMLISDRRFMRHMRFAPEKHWSSEDRECRVYDEMWSGNWWWRTQNIIGEGATIAPIILAVDKTHMTVLSGSKEAWPVYLSIGNISKDIRRKPSERAMVLVGFIPVTGLSGISNQTEKREKSWQLFHTCMESVLEPLKVASRMGVEMSCADGGIRQVHPILAAYIADYKEQCLVTCVRENRCPVCWVPADERADFDQTYGFRGKRETLDALKQHFAGNSGSVDILGIRPNHPFWADLPFVNISNCITPDILHQLNKGVFRDHVVKWCRSIIGKREVDRRIKGMPRFAGLRHFTQGISVLKQWTGNEAKALAKVFMPTLAGCSKPEAAAAARNLLDFMYCAHMPEMSDEDIGDLEGYLADFHDLKDGFVGTKQELKTMGDLPDCYERFHGIPKLHMIGHYAHFIRELGTADGYNTEVPERLHIDYVKVPWRASNHVNAIPQMTTYLQRQEAWAYLRVYLHDSGILLDPRFTNDDGAKEDEDMEELSGDGDDDEGLWHPHPTVSIAKRPTIGNQSATYLIEKHSATDLIPATLCFLRQLPTTPPGSFLPLSPHDRFRVWTRCQLVHKQLPFLPSIRPQVDRIRTLPRSVDDEGCMVRFGSFDMVLFSRDSNNDHTYGLHREFLIVSNLIARLTHSKGFQAGRIRAIFELPPHLKPVYDQKLVYLELFRPFSTNQRYPVNLYTTSHMLNANHRRCAVVLPLSRLRMACHLVPWYESLDPKLPISSSDDLLAIHNQFYFNKYVSHFIFVIMAYWRKQLARQW
ncbi:hypothetical protein FRC10_002580 [Ceratobasidium sp. 414]|nr:hypothetical protein FRC10_002580 [Ceratobasidium sp. 414]